ncbi:hypothetical protein [Mesorhizobium sp.]|uniref:hypothetical protein n=1 Tax=Mesorhizobium sp. TaxID=1871066 RepID=UPI00122272D6|nr:hypothetical protein [Mesorhizobium sp.]TIL42784.1 MAG: hypothetical protein E5Y86_25620 [Mesorhizobium sp.]
MNNLVSLEHVRWNLAIIWFIGSGFLALVLIAQSMGGAYGSQTQAAWSWALPNFLPTLALILSVFAAEALKDYEGKQPVVRLTYFKLSRGLTCFYMFVLIVTVLVQPFLPNQTGEGASSRVAVLQVSNLWLGPLQGLVVYALGVLFFLKQGEAAAPGFTPAGPHDVAKGSEPEKK